MPEESEQSNNHAHHNDVVLSQNEKKVHKAFISNTLSKLSSRTGVVALFLVVGASFLISQTFAGTVTKTFASEDGYVLESQPANPFSKGDHLRVRNSNGSAEVTYIRFNVAGVSGKKVNTAKLHIRSENTVGNQTINVLLVPTVVPVTGSTWNSQPSLAGAQKIGTLKNVRKATWNDVSLTRPVWADGPVEIALVATGGNEVQFSAIESNSSPQLLFDTDTPKPTGAAPAVTITAAPATLSTGGSTTLTWSSTNAATNCTASGDWTGTKASAGTEVVANLTAVKTYNFTLVCTNASGSGTATAHSTVSNGAGGGTGGAAAPVVRISAAPANISVGAASTLTWSSTNSPTSCTASGEWTGAIAASGNTSTGIMRTAGAHTYNISCANAAGHNNASVTVMAAGVTGIPTTPTTPPPTGNQVVGVPYNCNGPVNNLTIRGTGHDSRALVNIASGCTGTLNFDITVDPGGGDGVKVQGGAHDLNIGTSRIVCQRYTDTNMHQDGVQVQGGSNVIFHNLTIICPYVTGQGAGGFYIDGKDFGGISNVICDTCNLEHLHYGAFFTGPAPGSGVRNSIIHQGLLTHGYFANSEQAPVNTNNTLAPACEGTTSSPC